MLLIACLTLCQMVYAQKSKRGVDKVENRYLKGAVPLVNGYVQFEKTYKLPGKSKAELMVSLQDYIAKDLVQGEDQLPQSRITEVSPETGVIAASIQEFMYFKRTKWQIHRLQFYYQLVCQVEDGSIHLTMRNLHYSYEPEVRDGDFNDDRRAENWITDEAALTKGGTALARISGKYRVHTIDRKNELFRQAAQACGYQFPKKVITVETDED